MLKSSAVESIATPLGVPSDQFRYTVNKNGMLNQRQQQFYEENGFVVIPGLVAHDLIDECRDRFLDLIDGNVERGKRMFTCQLLFV